MVKSGCFLMCACSAIFAWNLSRSYLYEQAADP
jgi:hypothetical protein